MSYVKVIFHLYAKEFLSSARELKSLEIGAVWMWIAAKFKESASAVWWGECCLNVEERMMADARRGMYACMRFLCTRYRHKCASASRHGHHSWLARITDVMSERSHWIGSFWRGGNSGGIFHFHCTHFKVTGGELCRGEKIVVSFSSLLCAE